MVSMLMAISKGGKSAPVDVEYRLNDVPGRAGASDAKRFQASAVLALVVALITCQCSTSILGILRSL